jgi:hypothetical protein
MMRTFSAVGAIGVAAITLVGCSQIDSLKQVSGVPVNTLQIASDEILVANNIPVLEAPTCVQNDAGTAVDCTGSTTNGTKITVAAKNTTAATFTLAPGGTPTAVPNGALNMVMVLKVGNKTLYQGSVQEAIERSAVKAP